jgi:hypothetical protein
MENGQEGEILEAHKQGWPKAQLMLLALFSSAKEMQAV